MKRYLDKNVRGKKTEEEAIDEYMGRQKKALANIQLMVTDNVLVKILMESTAQGALKVLDDEYEPKTGVNKLLLKMSLYMSKMEEGSVDVEKYVVEKEKTIQQLRAIGCVVEEEDAALAILIGLPSSWSQFRSMVCAQMGKGGLTVATVKAAI